VGLPAPAARGLRGGGAGVGRHPGSVVRTPDGVRPAHRLGSGSHLVASLHLAEALAMVPADVEQVLPGDQVQVLSVR
jgi:molybdopterin molybdotransferase